MLSSRQQQQQQQRLMSWQPIKPHASRHDNELFRGSRKTNQQSALANLNQIAPPGLRLVQRQPQDDLYSSLTRTMFFQPIRPRPAAKPDSTTATPTTTTTTTTAGQQQQLGELVGAEQELQTATTTSSSYLEPADSGRRQPITPQQTQPATPFNPATTSPWPAGQPQFASSDSKGILSPTTSHKRGTIIATADSSPTRGYLSQAASAGSSGIIAGRANLLLLIVSLLVQSFWSLLSFRQSYGFMGLFSLIRPL